MKKYIIIALYLVLCASPSHAMWAIGATGGSVASGSSCIAEPDGGLATDGFEGTGGALELSYNAACYENPPSWCDDSGETFVSLSPMGDGRNCTYGMRFNATGTSKYISFRLGATQATVYAKFSLYVASYNLGTYDNFSVLNIFDNTSGDSLASVKLYTTGAEALQIYGTSGVGSNESSKATISTGTWYYITLYASNGSSSCSVGVGTTYDGTDILNPASSGVFTCITPTNNINQFAFSTGPRTVDYIIGYISMDADGTF